MLLVNKFKNLTGLQTDKTDLQGIGLQTEETGLQGTGLL